MMQFQELARKSIPEGSLRWGKRDLIYFSFSAKPAARLCSLKKVWPHEKLRRSRGRSFFQTNSWPAKEFLVIGILGGFTTFSTFGMELYRLMETGYLVTALFYMIGSVIAGIFGIYLSQFLTKQI